MARPMLGGVELQQVQTIEVGEDQVLAQHGVPALEGDFFQGLERRATRVTLAGVLTGAGADEGLKTLREKFHAAEPLPFVADITTATKVEQVLIEELGVRELAGKPERFEYALTLREFIPPPAPETTPPPEQPVEPPSNTTGTLVVEVVVEGQPNFDFSTVTVTVGGTQDDGTSFSRTLTAREDNVWTAVDMPPGQYTARAVVTAPQPLSGSATATVRAGQTQRVRITLRATDAIAKAFVVHFWFDKAFVEPCMRHVLQRAVEYASAHADEKLVIVGHTDLVGSGDYNQALSERRARAVFAYLTAGRDKAAALAEWNALRRGPSGGLSDNWGVREYQFMLQDLGFYAGSIDEVHGVATDLAVRDFQRGKGLAVDGVVGENTWAALNEAYLAQDNLAVPESQFLRNAAEGCDGGLLKWLGCGEQDPVKNTQDAWRPNRRVELLFVRADSLPCKVPPPVTFALPAPGAVGSTWCLGPGDPNARCCFATREAAQPGKWLIQPAEPQKTTVSGTITFEDGTPVANAKYVLIAPDGEYLHTDDNGQPDLGERPQGAQRGRPIADRADENGQFNYPRETPEGVYVLELFDLAEPAVARLNDEPPEEGRGNVLCKRLSAAAPAATLAASGAPATVGAVVMAAPAAGGNVTRPQITLASPVVVVKRSYTTPARQVVTLRANGVLASSGTFQTSDPAKIRFFTAAAGGSPLAFAGGDNVFTAAQLTSAAGVQLFAEGVAPSAAMNDVKLTLTLAAPPKPPVGPPAPPVGPPARVSMTAVEVTLDIFMSRIADAVEPAALAQPPDPAPAPGTATDKWFGGRFVHIQDPGNHHGRALIVVRKRPITFEGTLVLSNVTVAGNAVTGPDTRVKLFVPEFGGALAPLEFPAKPIPAAGQRFWAEGAGVSAALRDTGLQLGIKGLEPDGDRVRLTVVRLSNLQADIPSTPPNTARLTNGPVPNARFRRGTGATPIAADFDTNFVANEFLVLIQGGLPAGSPVQLSVNVAPVGVPVSWSVLRDTRPSPNGDDPSVVALSPKPIPTITQNPGNALLATLQDHAVGSFHIQPFVDCNGDATFNNTRNKEPFMTMNLVLVRVGGAIGATNSANTSVAQPASITLAPAVGAATSATGVTFSSGTFANPGGAGVHSNATIVIVGGGRKGRIGLDNLFAGWVNNVTALNIVATYRDLGTGNVHTHTSLFATNRPGAPPNLGLFLPAGVVPPVGFPPANVSTAIPINTPFPFLDTSPFGNEGTGGNTAVGTETGAAPGPPVPPAPPTPAAGPHRGIRRVDLAVGQTWQIQMWDSPGHPCLANHLAFPGRLISFLNNIDFQTDLCFWTNVTSVPGPTPGPITGALPPTPNAACCSYATVQTNTWQIRFLMNFPVPAAPPPPPPPPPPPSVGVVATQTLTLVRDAAPLRLARPVAATAEVRLPIALRLFAIDAQH